MKRISVLFAFGLLIGAALAATTPSFLSSGYTPNVNDTQLTILQRILGFVHANAAANVTPGFYQGHTPNPNDTEPVVLQKILGALIDGGGGGGGTNLNLNSGQFSVIDGTNISIATGASLTNTALVGTPTINGVAASTVPTNANFLLYDSTNVLLSVGKALQAGANIVFTPNSTGLVVSATSSGTNGFTDPGANGVVVRVATNTSTARTLTGTANEISIANGTGVSGDPTFSLSLLAKFLSVTNRAALEALTGLTDGTPVILKGYTVAGDAPAVLYTFVSGDTSTVDNGSVITNASGRFKLQVAGNRVDIRQFGAIADYSGEVAATWTNNSTNLTLSTPLTTSYVGKKVGIRRGATSIGATITAQCDSGTGAVTNFVVGAGGQGYINVPSVILSVGPGSGGTFTPVLTGGAVSSITIGAGGTLYANTNTFLIRSLDVDTTNAPYYSQTFTVATQSGTAIGLSGTPNFSWKVNTGDDAGVAIFYTDNKTSIQNALNYATNVGAEVFIPAGNWASGSLYLNSKQQLRGASRDSAILYFTPTNYTGVRFSQLMSANFSPTLNSVIYDGLLGDVTISDLTLDGNGQWQDPLGTGFLDGSFALMGIYMSAAENWSVKRVTARNCQGDGIYFGSHTPTGGASGNWAAVQTRRVSIEDCTLWSNWRNGSQLGNCTGVLIDGCLYTNNSYGVYLSRTTRNTALISPYSDEEIDAEANSNATSGFNRITRTKFSSEYGRGIDFLFDQQKTDIVDCDFVNLKSGGITQSAGPYANTANNQEWSADYSLIMGNRFICTSTNYGPHIGIRDKGVRLIGNYFEGGTGLPSSAVVLADANASYPPNYVLDGIIWRDNIFNLKANSGGTVGSITVPVSNGAVQKFKFDNTIIEGIVDMRAGTRFDESNIEKMTTWQEPFVYAATQFNGRSIATTAGIGQSDFTVTCKVELSTTANAALMTIGNSSLSFTEFRLSTKSSAGGFLELLWNPNNSGSRTITIPTTAIRNQFGGAPITLSTVQRPINFSVVRKRGSVWAITVTNVGSGYTSVPSVVVSGGGGTLGAGVAQLSAAGTITNIYVTVGGSGYTGTTNPIVTISGGGGSGAAATASSGKLQFWLDDELCYEDTGTDCITPCATVPMLIFFQSGTGAANTKLYSYAIWNKSLDDSDLRRYFLHGPATGDRWGTWNSTAGCLTWVKCDSGVGQFFEDKSANALHQWSGLAITHSTPKRTGQALYHFVSAAAITNNVNIASAGFTVIPANARITSVYCYSSSGTPAVVVGFDAALANPITTSQTLALNVTNYLPLVQAYIYGSTNRPVYISQSTAATVDYVINYTLDQGELVGPHLGFQDGSSAAAGDVSEQLTSAVAVGSAFNMATTVVTNVTSLTLTPGRWLVHGNFNFTGTNSTITAMSAGITSTTATIPTDGTEQNSWVALTTTSFKNSIALKPKYFTVSATTPVYLVGVGTFSTANSVGGYGSMVAQRIW